MTRWLFLSCSFVAIQAFIDSPLQHPAVLWLFVLLLILAVVLLYPRSLRLAAHTMVDRREKIVEALSSYDQAERLKQEIEA